MTTTTPTEAGVTSNSDKNNPRELFGWKMYDWANSAFYTTVVGALFSPYLTRLAQTAVGENGVVLDGDAAVTVPVYVLKPTSTASASTRCRCR